MKPINFKLLINLPLYQFRNLCINQYIADKMTNNNSNLCFKPYLCYIYTIYTESTKIRVQKFGTVALDIGTTVIYFYYRVPVVLVN